MWTFRRRYLFLLTGLLIGLAVLYFSRDHQPVLASQEGVKGQHHHNQPIKNIVPLIPLREDTYKLIDEEIKQTELIDDSLQDKGPHIDEELKTIEISLDKGEELDPQETSEIDYGAHVQNDRGEDEPMSNATKVTESNSKKLKGNSINYIQRGNNSTVKASNQQQQQFRNSNMRKVNQDISNVNTTQLKDGVFHVEQGSGGLDESLQDGVQDRSQGSPSFWRRVDEYCNQPNAPVGGDEGHVVSGDYHLRSVHMVMRHGDRTPMGEIKFPWLKWNPKWTCDLQETSKKQNFSQLADLIANVSATPSSGETLAPKVAMFLQRLPVGRESKVCARAQLTPQGWMQQILLGQHMRAAYSGSLFSKTATWRDMNVPVKVHSTLNARTQQSAFAFMYGLLPGLDHRDGALVQRVLNINFCRGIKCSCPASFDLGEIKDKLQGKKLRENKSLKEVLQQISKIILLPDLSKKEQKMFKLPGLSTLQEVFFAALCHNKSLPCRDAECVTPDHFDSIVKGMDDVAEELRSSEDTPHSRYGRLYMHPFLSVIAENMETLSNKSKKPPQFNLYSGHDLTVLATIDAIGLPDHRWPHYASHLVFELWNDKFFQHYVRVLYNGEDQTKHVRFCRGRVNKDGLCPLPYFLSFIKQDNMQYFKTNSYAEACQLQFRN